MVNIKSKPLKILLLIDGNALVHRAFHALPELTDPNGRLVNAVYGFSSILLKALNELKPDYVAATFDMAGPTFRHEEFKEYKAHRVKAAQELYNQIPLIKKLLGNFNIPVFERQGYEADDIIGTIASRIKNQSRLGGIIIKTIIATGDLDTLQLVDKNTNVYTLKKGIKDTTIYDEKAVMERYGLKPSQLIDFKGLKGDPSDNIPGVPGVGDKTASLIVKKYGTIENAYRSIEAGKQGTVFPPKLMDKLLANKELAFFSKKLVTIKLNVPIEFDIKKCAWQKYSKEKVIELFKEFGFRSLAPRLPVFGSPVPKLEAELPNKEPPGESPLILEEIKKFYHDKIFSQNIYEMEKRLIPVLSCMRDIGIKVDRDHLNNLSKKIARQLKDLEKRIYELAGESFNINSSRQLSEILFKKLNIALNVLRKTPGGVISTAAPELAKIKDSHSIIPLILNYRELVKLKTTYTDALPALINPKTGRIHTTFHQLGAATGRLSSSGPNLQNIPVRTDLGKEIRKAFIADEDYKLVSFDYSQVELRIAASIALDRKMISAFKDGQDIHRLTAAEVNNVAVDGVTDEMRYQAKALNFGILYGMSIQGFAESAGISRDNAKKFIKEYTEGFLGIASYIKNIKEYARQFGFVKTVWGRKRFLPNINSGDWQIRQSSERMAINMPIQGTAADIIKMAMVEIYEKFVKNNKNDDIRMPLQVHDELLFEIRKDKLSEYIKPIKDIMEHVMDLAAPLTVNVATGNNWKEMEKYGNM